LLWPETLSCGAATAADVKLQVRNYEVYRLLEESMKAMLTSLPLVQVSRTPKCVASQIVSEAVLQKPTTSVYSLGVGWLVVC